MKQKIKTEATWGGAHKVYDNKGQCCGKIHGSRKPCSLEGCTGTRLLVIWKDGKRTWPCTGGLKFRKDGQIQIMV